MPIHITSITPANEFSLDGIERLSYTSDTDGATDWTLARPGKRGSPGASTWVVQIHGHGSSGDQLFTRPDIRQHWLPRYLEKDFGVLSPNLRGNAWMSPAAASDLQSLLTLVRERYDVKKFLLISGSMGGTSNVIFSSLFPELIAGTIAMCPATDLVTYRRWCEGFPAHGTIQDIRRAIETGYGNEESKMAAHSAVRHAARLTMPVFIAHGNADAIIPVSESRTLAAAMPVGSNFYYMEMENGDHDAPLWQIETALAWLLPRVG
ncbi:MAG: alpha/beta fold hydrolase [Planctomycetes bacterium]|nr:alpha/beta fold hydrolase [Planctomycetota bacterium]